MSPSKAHDDAVEIAFAQVLAAEQSAHEAIARAHAAAAESAECARADTRARGERARRHIAAVRAAFERRVQADLARLAGQAEASRIDPPLDDADRARVEQAVHRLAAELTGADTRVDAHVDAPVDAAGATSSRGVAPGTPR